MRHSALLGSWISVGALACLGACNSTETPAGTGGAPATGGVNASGGTATSGGVTSSGGVAALSGGTATGGSTTGGTSAGGASPTGGSASGGKATGGSPASGGTTGTGGAPPTTGCGATTLPAACNTTTTGPCTLDVNGTTRQFFVVLPSNYSATTTYPLVFAWHGLGGTAQSLLGSTYYAGFYGVRTTFANAIYVTAQGLDTGSDSGTQYGWPNTNGRDVNFTKAMLTWLEQNYCIDTTRIFSTGMSYGGMMSNTLGCQMPDVFRALGVMSGSLYGTSSCSTHPIAAWFTHGDADATVPIAGDQTARDMFISHNGCSTTNTTTTTLTSTVDGGTVTTVCTIYNQCTAGNYPVVWCPVPGEGHAIPSWAGAEIAKFFQQF